MYSIFIFLIALVLFLFEIIVIVFFGKESDSNVLILSSVMILPGIFELIKYDSVKYINMFRGSLTGRVLRRKQFYFFLELLKNYSIVFTLISFFYIGLCLLINNWAGLYFSIAFTLIFIAITAITNIIRQIFIHS